MWQMLQQPRPDEYALATGETHSVEELLAVAFSSVGLPWHKYVEVDPALLRPAEVDDLCGNSAKAQGTLGWAPETTFTNLIEMMA